MADPQTIVDQIRAIITATDQTKTPQLIELASEYAALCNEVNNRLRKCTDFLRKGLRAEAIHLAEQHPALLDMVAVLDLGGQPEWPQICATYELAQPPPLNVEAAQELNEAYATAHPLKALFDLHRRLALESAPLIDRIMVMRQLAAADPESAFWDGDIRVFEATCLKQLKVDATTAIRNSDRPAIARLLGELTTEGWRIELPGEIRTALERADGTLGQQEVLHEVRQVMRELDAAYGAMNLASVTAILQKIAAMIAGRVTLPADLASRFAQAELWAKKQMRRAADQAKIEAALNALSEAIAEKAPIEELERLVDQLTNAGGAVPDDIQPQIQAAADHRANAIRKRKRQRMAMAAGFVFVMLLTAGIVVRAVVRNNRGAEACRILSEHYNEGDFAAAQADIKRLTANEPYILERDDVRKIVGLLAASQMAEQERRANFDSAVASAKTSTDFAAKSTDASTVAWGPAIKASDEANSLAKLPEEMIKVSQLRDQIADHRQKIQVANQEAKEQEIRGSLEKLTHTFELLASQAAAGTLAADDGPLVAAISEATRLVSASTGQLHIAAQEIFTKLKDLSVKVARLKAESDREKLESARMKAERQELESLGGFTATPAKLSQALKQFIQNNPESEHKLHFEKALTHADNWAAVDAAAVSIASWRGTLYPDPATGSQRMLDIDAYLKKYANSPWQSIFSDYKAYLAAGKEATSDKGPWKGQLAAYLSAPLFQDLQYLKETGSGRRYYLRHGENIHKDVTGTHFRFVIGVLRGGKQFKLSDKDKRGQFDGKPADSPQSVLASAMERTVKSMGDDWETLAARLAANIGNANEVDSICRVILLEQVLDCWQRASAGNDDLLMSATKPFADFGADDLPWLDPDDPKANSKRDDAEKVLRRQVDAFEKLGKAILARRDDLAKRLSFRVVGRGVLLKEHTGWTILTADKTEPGQLAFAIKSGNWSQVAEFHNGKFAIDGKAADDELDGDMVFILPPPGPVPAGK